MGNSPSTARSLDRYARYRKMLVHELFRPRQEKFGLYDLRRQLFNSLVTIAEEGLKEAFSAVPPDKQLRNLISQWLQDVRRDRSQITISTLLRDPSAGKEPLVRYIQRRWAKMSPAPKTDLSTIQAANTLLIRSVMPDLDGDD